MPEDTERETFPTTPAPTCRTYSPKGWCEKEAGHGGWHSTRGGDYVWIQRRESLPTPADLRGSDPDFTGGVETVEHLRGMRDGD